MVFYSSSSVSEHKRIISKWQVKIKKSSASSRQTELGKMWHMTNKKMISLFKNKVVIEGFKPKLAINIKGVDPMSHEKSKI